MKAGVWPSSKTLKHIEAIEDKAYTEEKILEFLESGPKTRNEITRYLHHNVKAAVINTILMRLYFTNVLDRKKIRTPGKAGKPATMWFCRNVINYLDVVGKEECYSDVRLTMHHALKEAETIIASSPVKQKLPKAQGYFNTYILEA